ncbi:MAG: hypothetical protein H0X65_12385 [Gemmatimonadetes bacterium]|nr:hypothetical protein [Gemmatimonadota bacterium]
MTSIWQRRALVAIVVSLACLYAASAEAQAGQSELTRQLLHGDRGEQLMAAEVARGIGGRNIDEKLRGALIEVLEREGRLDAQRRRGDIGFLDNPELIARLALVVAELRDPRAIPALAGAVHTSPPAAKALAAFGEPAAAAVLEVANSRGQTAVVNSGLITLRLMIEGAGKRPLSPGTRQEIRQVAQRHMSAEYSVTTLWRSIDLAVVLDDPEIRRMVELLATDRNEVIARGVTEPDLIEQTQKRARERLAGVPPLPRS